MIDFLKGECPFSEVMHIDDISISAEILNTKISTHPFLCNPKFYTTEKPDFLLRLHNT